MVFLFLGPDRLASPRVNGYLVKASSNPFTFYDSPLPGVNTPWDVMRIVCNPELMDVAEVVQIWYVVPTGRVIATVSIKVPTGRLARQKEEEDNLISWDNTQAMMEANYELAQRLQAEEHGELAIEERSKLFVELMDKKKKHFAKLRAEDIRIKPTTKAQKRNQMYSFVPMDTEVVERSKIQAEGSNKKTREELESDNSKKQMIDENVEAEVDDEAKMKRLTEIVPNDEVAIDAIPLATKSPIINIDIEDLETLWKLVKAKHGNTRPEEAYERMLWGDLKVMFEPDIESDVWRNLQGYNVTVWKLFSSSGVHFVRF
ncbi:hypothetical protein Tco_1401090 [Tanacetum coccineum]